MKESCRRVSLLRSRDGQLGVKAEDFRKMDIHVHVPAARCQKTGPQPVSQMFTALASLFCKDPFVLSAMTGEITLRDSFCRSAD